MTHAKPTQEELLNWCVMIMTNYDPKNYLYNIAEALRDRLQPSLPAVAVDRDGVDVEILETAKLAQASIDMLTPLFDHLPEEHRWRLSEMILRLRIDVARPEVAKALEGFFDGCLKSSPATGKE